MLFEVRDGTKVPIFEQIVNQVVFAVASGALEVGELIPSVRDLAVRLRINPNTVARAYQELEKDEVLAARRGLGMEVTADAPGCASRGGGRSYRGASGKRCARRSRARWSRKRFASWSRKNCTGPTATAARRWVGGEP